MIRTTVITLFAALGLSAPATAGTLSENSAASHNDARFTRFDASLNDAATAQQIRRQLAQSGYTHVSSLMRDSSGRFAGTAVKNGKTVIVAVIFPSVPRQQPATE